jgi:hypothetical protein
MTLLEGNIKDNKGLQQPWEIYNELETKINHYYKLSHHRHRRIFNSKTLLPSIKSTPKVLLSFTITKQEE